MTKRKKHLSTYNKEQALEAVYNHLNAASSNALLLGISYKEFNILARKFLIDNAIDLHPLDKKSAMSSIGTVRQMEYHTNQFANPLIAKLNKKYLRY